jgi:hypothetical protein
MESMSATERWIIGSLMLGLSAVIWFLILDVRSDVRTVTNIVHINSNRLTALEGKTIWLEQASIELRKDLSEHRVLTERSK